MRTHMREPPCLGTGTEGAAWERTGALSAHGGGRGSSPAVSAADGGSTAAPEAGSAPAAVTHLAGGPPHGEGPERGLCSQPRLPPGRRLPSSDSSSTARTNPRSPGRRAGGQRCLPGTRDR